MYIPKGYFQSNLKYKLSPDKNCGMVFEILSVSSYIIFSNSIHMDFNNKNLVTNSFKTDFCVPVIFSQSFVSNQTAERTIIYLNPVLILLNQIFFFSPFSPTLSTTDCFYQKVFLGQCFVNRRLCRPSLMSFEFQFTLPKTFYKLSEFNVWIYNRLNKLWRVGWAFDKLTFCSRHFSHSFSSHCLQSVVE